MKKKFTFLMAALILLTMMVLPGKAVGQTTATFDWSLGGNMGSNATGTVGQITLTGAANSASGAPVVTSNTLRLYAHRSSGNGASATFTAASNYKISEIEVKCSKNSSVLKYATDGGSIFSSFSFSNNVASVTGLNVSSVTLKNCQNSGNSNNTISIDYVVVTYASTSGNITLTYKANNGSATPDVTESVTSGGSTTLKPSNTFSFDGHTFYKWNTAANGSGTDYEAGATLSNITSAYTFYARWNYNVAIGTVTGTTITVTYNETNLTGNTNAVPRGAQIILAHGELAANQEFVWSIVDDNNNDITSTVLSGTTLTVPDKNITIGGSVVQEDPSFEIVFAATDNGGNCQSNSGSWNVTGGSLALSCAANSSSGAPAYNSSSEELRIYGNANGGGSITLTPTTVSITKVVLTASNNYANAVKYYINGASTGTSLSWNGTTGTVDNINGYITFQNAENGTTQVRIKKIKIYYSVPETFIPTVALNNDNYGTLEGPTENVYTITPNAGYKIVDFTKTENVTVTQLTGDAFSTSTYNIIASASGQTVTFNLAARTSATVTLHDGLNGTNTTSVNTYADATLADVIAGHSIASVNGWTALGWVKSYTSGTPTLIATSEAVGTTTDLYAVYKKGSNTFSRITSTDDLAVDGVYMICYNSNSTYNFMNDVSSNYMGYTDANSVSENSFEYVAGKKFTLGGSAGAYTLYDGSKYLTATSGQQYLGLASGSTDDVAKWTITFDNNNAKIKNNGLTGDNVYVSYYASKNYFNMYTNYSTIYLFKQITNVLQYSIAPTAELCHVYYNANGATSGNVPEDNTGYNPNTNVTILGNTGTLAKTGYTWSGWCLNAEGTGTVYGPGYTTTYTLPENTTFYAKWVVNSHDWSTDLTNAVSGTTAQLIVNNAVVAVNTQIAFGTEVTVDVTVPNGYIYSISVNSGAVSVNNNKFTMPDENVAVVVTTELNPYEIHTLSSDNMKNTKDENGNAIINSGGTNTSGYGVLKFITTSDGVWISNGYQQTASGVVSLGMLQLRDRGHDDGVSYIQLPVFNGKIETITMTVTSGSGTASNAGGCKALLNFQTGNTSSETVITSGGDKDNGTGSITLDLTSGFYSTGYITASIATARIWNIDVNIRPYQDMTGTEFTIAADRMVSIPASTNATAENLTIPANSGVIIKSGASLTVSGTLTNSGTAANLIIEDGGQLIIPSSGSKTDVKATFQRDITAYEQANGKDNYYLIANPTTDVDGMDPTTVVGMIAGNYDLYYFDEAQSGAEWRNYKKVPFNLFNGKGYLYANSSDRILNFPGTVPTGTTADITLSKLGSGTYAGFNLVGNPLSNNVATMKIVEDEEEKSCSYYKVNSDNGVFAVSTAPITVGEAFMVQAPSNVAVLKLNQGVAKGEDGFNNEVIRLEVSNSKFTDVAYVYFGNHLPLTKINHLNDEAPMLYIHNENSDRAVEVYNNRGEVKSVDVNFEAKTTGTYTISAKMMKGEVKYMHLYDRLTGIDTDLLMDDYSFIGAKSDIAGRFILNLESVDNNSSTGSDTFAYQSGNDIIVNGEGTLAVYDVTGRKVLATTINGVETINGLNSGVYIFRIIGETLRTQKIVVR